MLPERGRWLAAQLSVPRRAGKVGRSFASGRLSREPFLRLRAQFMSPLTPVWRRDTKYALGSGSIMKILPTGCQIRAAASVVSMQLRRSDCA